MTTNKPEVVAVVYQDGGVLTKQECGTAFDTCCKVETPLIRLSDYEALRKEAVGLVAALEAIQIAANHKSTRTGIQAGTALGLIAALCDFALAARRKQGGDQ